MQRRSPRCCTSVERWWCGIGMLALASAACRSPSEEAREGSGAQATGATAAPITTQREVERTAEPVPSDRAQAELMPPPTHAPAASPRLPPQLVACGERDFYRITRDALQVYETSPALLPSNIRGRQIARQTAQTPITRPTNVLTLSGKRALVIAPGNVFQHQLGALRARRHAPISLSAPLTAWADPQAADAFWVRGEAQPRVQRFVLSSKVGERTSATDSAQQANSAGNAAGTEPANSAGSAVALQPSEEPEYGLTSSRVDELPEFDSRLFTPLPDGTPLFSTPRGLRKLAGTSGEVAFPMPAGPATTLMPDAARGRYWAGDAAGNLALWDERRGESPLFSTKLPGAVVDSAREGTRFAVLSIELEGQSYQPLVTVFENGKQQVQLRVAPGPASLGQPVIDLCLLPGRPWVVVGGRDWLQLLDWTGPRLLAEW